MVLWKQCGESGQTFAGDQAPKCNNQNPQEYTTSCEILERYLVFSALDLFQLNLISNVKLNKYL